MTERAAVPRLTDNTQVQGLRFFEHAAASYQDTQRRKDKGWFKTAVKEQANRGFNTDVTV